VVAVLVTLLAVAGGAVAGKQPVGPVEATRAFGPTAHASATRHGATRTQRSGAAARAAELEGATALASRTFVIPPPRWLASHRGPVDPSTRLEGLNWQVDPYMD
jgi:hypothetical protein